MENNRVLNGLIDSLKLAKGDKNKNIRAMMVQAYIQQYGPIPNERGEEVRALLAGKESEEIDLEEAFNNADGTITITVDGTVAHIHGECDRQALLLGAHAIIFAVAKRGDRSFEDAMKLVSNLHDCFDTKIDGEIAK